MKLRLLYLAHTPPFKPDQHRLPSTQQLPVRIRTELIDIDDGVELSTASLAPFARPRENESLLVPYVLNSHRDPVQHPCVVGPPGEPGPHGGETNPLGDTPSQQAEESVLAEQ